jgi:hypothetical protein
MSTSPAFAKNAKGGAKRRIPTFTKKRLLRNSEFLLQIVLRAAAERNILRFEAADSEFRNSLTK